MAVHKAGGIVVIQYLAGLALTVRLTLFSYP